jgi:hypothetical protein
MKTIINGTRYDTDKATKIGYAYGGSEFVTDFSYWTATLYVTPRSKRYFLAGQGGPMTRFRRTVAPSQWTGGEALIPLDEAEALEWAEKYLPSDEVEEFFGHLIEDA